MTSPAARKLRAALLPGLAVGVVVAAAALPRDGALERLEKVLYDVRAARAAASQPASPAVALVALDDDTIRLAGGTYPIPRGALAAIVEEARHAGARVVVVDLLLQDPLEGSLADENAALERALAHGDVVVGAAVPPAPAGAGTPFRLAPPLPRFAAAAAAVGGVTQEQEEDGRVHALRHVYATDAGEV
ncbi:MAG TPA: CHASE2 domain-containing protein, partial [Anaeromyxobacter sp.]